MAEETVQQLKVKLALLQMKLVTAREALRVVGSLVDDCAQCRDLQEIIQEALETTKFNH